MGLIALLRITKCPNSPCAFAIGMANRTQLEVCGESWRKVEILEGSLRFGMNWLGLSGVGGNVWCKLYKNNTDCPLQCSSTSSTCSIVDTMTSDLTFVIVSSAMTCRTDTLRKCTHDLQFILNTDVKQICT